jgi:pseudouridine-5'-phosphate glycosidase
MSRKSIDSLLSLSPEVADARDSGKAIVALESTIISHGMPYPQNVETALTVEQKIRDKGAIPATIAIVDGRLCAGLTAEQIEQIGTRGQGCIKVSRRDIPFVLGDASVPGTTTVAATMIVASMAGISVFATGGIGGVHRGASETFDVSADLQELANTSVAVVCAGAKSILDIALTREYLETHGVPVMGYQTDCWPAFYTSRSPHPVDYVMDTAQSVAEALSRKQTLKLSGGALICVPVPEQYSQNEQTIDNAINAALTEMAELGITGKDTTPFLLAKIAEITEGSSLQTNIQLVLNNADVASDIALALVAMDSATG